MKNIKSSLIWISTCLLACSIIIFYIIKQTNYNKTITEINTINENDIIFGSKDIKPTVILYFNYNCGYCKKFFSEAYPLLENLINTSKIKLVLRPVCGKTDKAAMYAYQTAICLNKYGDYSKLHKLLLHENKIIYTEDFRKLVDDIIYANSDIAECILNNNNKTINKNNYQFQTLKVKGTPTFVIGNKILRGYQDFEKIINTLESEYEIKL